MSDRRQIAAPDAWSDLRALTPARLALGRAGAGLPTGEVLRFAYAHASARDAVHVPFDDARLAAEFAQDGRASLTVASAAPDRATYLLRPDLGRRLDAADATALRAHAATHAEARGCDLLLVIGDGLSSLAVARHARPLVEAVHARNAAEMQPLAIAPVVVLARQARVALADEIGALLQARAVAILIGERPGLSSPDSLGVYLTYAPRPGRSDAERNCISNVRPEGLAYAQAAHKLVWLARAALARGLTGVALKDESAPLELGGAAARALGG